ncbi:MAG: hypothetical protein J6U23_06130 [Clostridiales bacterium]|nr:hypothetical protein [Clostridiales bacterium]
MKLSGKIMTLISVILVISFVVPSCTSTKEKKKSRSRRDETEEITKSTPEETTNEETGESRKVLVLESAMYDSEESPVKVDWSNYQPADYDTNICTRLSEDYISDFIPSDDYGTIFPYIGTRDSRYYAEDGHLSDYVYNNGEYSYGFFDENGRIICDSVFAVAWEVEGFSCYEVVKSVQGEYMYGLINASGSKYTGLKYRNIIYATGVLYAWNEECMDVYNDDLDIVSSVHINLDMSKLAAYSPELSDVSINDISIHGQLDDDHVRLFVQLDDYTDVLRLDINTGDLSVDYSGLFRDPNIGIWNDDNGVYLCDLNGNRLSDYYCGLLIMTDVPIFFDEEHNGYGLNSQGAVIKELGKLDILYFTHFKDYFVVVSDEGEATLYDYDFNSYGSFRSDRCLRIVHWGVKYAEIDDPYVMDDGDIIDPFTGEVIIEDVPDARNVYMDDGIMAATDWHTYYLSNGKTFPHTGNTELKADMVLGDLYVLVAEDDHLEIYNASKDIEYSIDGEFSVSYVDILNDNLVSYYDGVTTLYDISDPDNPIIVFQYQSIDPFVD